MIRFPKSYLSQLQTPPRNEINEVVDRKIRAVTRLAYDHNGFYHSLFEKAGMNPHTEISGRNDLIKAFRKGVRTVGSDLQKCYADYATEIPILELWTSGSSNMPKKLLLSPDEIDRRRRGQERVWLAAGIKDGQKVVAFPAPPPYSTSFSQREGLRKLNVRTLIFSLPNLQKGISESERARVARSYIDMLMDYNPDYVRGGVWAVSVVPEFLQEYGFDARKMSVKSVLFGGDPTTKEKRKEIGKIWNAEPFDHYSSAETGNLSHECGAHIGMHLNEPDVLLCSVSQDSGEEVSPDEDGLDLNTTLFDPGEKPGTFIINYSHGDHIKILSEKCTCGREFGLMDHPTRDSKKKPISGYGFDIRNQKSLVGRAFRKVKRTIS